jgi:hypothetical protein
MLSHFLAGRKDLSLASLEQALERIGYRLRIVLNPAAQSAGRLSAEGAKAGSTVGLRKLCQPCASSQTRGSETFGCRQWQA